MKALLKILLGLVILILVGVALLPINSLIKDAAESYGSEFLQTPVRVENVDVSLLSGALKISGFVIENPDQFTTDNALSVGLVDVAVSLPSLLTDTIVVKKIHVAKPSITVETNESGNNYVWLGSKIYNTPASEPAAGAAKSQPPAQPQEEAAAEGEGKKLIIEKLLIEEGSIVMAGRFIVVQGKTSIPLPRIEMTDIGKDKEGGADLKEVIQSVSAKVMSYLPGVSTEAIGGTMKQLEDGVKGLGDMINGFFK